MARHHYVPKDYEDLYEHYFDVRRSTLASGLVRRWAPTADDAAREDLVHDAWMRMARQGLLERFDPERGNFGLLVHQVVRSEVFNWHAKQLRTPTAGAKAVPSGPLSGGGGPYWNESPGEEEYSAGCLGSTEATQHDQAEAMEIVDRVYRFTQEAAEASGSPRTGQHLWEVFETLARGGQCKEAAESIGVSPAAVSGMRRRILDAIEEARAA